MKMNKTILPLTTTLFVVCIAFLAGNLYSMKSLPRTTGDSSGGGKSISKSDAEKMVTDFGTLLKSPSHYQGIFFSKEAISTIFGMDSTATGIACYFAADADHNVRIIMTPSHSIKTGVDTSKGTAIFMSNSFCPEECGLLFDAGGR